MRIEIYGSPGSGKSALGAYIYRELKKRKIEIAFIQEFVKDWAYERIPIEGYMNLYASTHHIYKEDYYLRKKLTGCIVSDSPPLLGYVYAKLNNAKGYKGLEYTLVEYEKENPAIHVFLKMNPDLPYSPSGRYQTKEESEKLQYRIFSEVASFLNNYTKRARIKTLTAGKSAEEDELIDYIMERHAEE